MISPLPVDIYLPNESPVIFSEEGKILWFSTNTQHQFKYCPIGAVPDKLKSAILIFEDEFFYRHFGINPASLLKAAWGYMNGNRKRGASTITMQCARIYFGNPKRTIFQKIKEILFAVKLEWKWNKEEIFTWYMNHAPFGRNYIGYYTAALAYFGKLPEHLTWAEAATLAVIPQNPSSGYPGKNTKKLLIKRNFLLHKLFIKGKISRAEWLESLLENIPRQYQPLPSFALHLFEHLKKRNGLNGSVRTFIQYDLQKKMQLLVNEYIDRYKVNEVNNISLMIADIDSGKVRAYVGNGDFSVRNPNFWIDHNLALRSTGSTLKPLLYAFALEKKIIYPDSWLSDVPEYFGNYDPANASGNYDGVVAASQALARSLNVPFVELLRKTGIPAFLEKLKWCGITNISKPSEYYGLSVILGAAECSPEELTLAYLNLLYSAKNAKISLNKLLYTKDDVSTFYFTQDNVFHPGAAYATITSMREFQYSKTPGRSGNNKHIYYKTGTSFGFRDAWAVGTNGKFVVCVWVGNAEGEGRPGLTGTDYAVPILLKAFQLLKSENIICPRSYYTKVKVCSFTGYGAGEYCENITDILVPSCAIPAPKCPYHIQYLTDSAGLYRYEVACAPPDAVFKKSLCLNPEQELYYKMKNPSFMTVPPLHPDCINENNRDFQIIYPKEGLQLVLPKSSNFEKQNFVFKAVSRNVHNQLKWYLNENFLGETKGVHQLPVFLSKGKYCLKLMDIYGQTEEVNFEVM
ncbi:MAG: penicillin-binding protein 1C [Bacteroidia bacterium]|nr:penicillin-binding protein 1C [Bacteroidia bacterium]